MKKLVYTLYIIASFSSLSLAQPPELSSKNVQVQRIQQSLKIDGVLDEPVWVSASVAGDFVQNSPNPGKVPSQRTEVKILYDNTAIYIGATLFDSRPDSILKELTERDEIGNSDWFAVVIGAYRDGNNGVGFAVTPGGIQFDTKYSSAAQQFGGFGGLLNDGQRTWDAVWNSAAKMTGEGWVVEMKIPYSAIRFPNSKEQSWHVNFARQIRRHREMSFWNAVDPNLKGYLNQCGTLGGISDIQSPPRLSATPFFSFYAEKFSDQNASPPTSWGRSFNGGMDIKYGINDAFTLDMTLIPDFGQVRSDNQVLNLSPFEVRFDENRQFFTEGTELFNKGGLFYSRRVGGTPIHYGAVYDQLSDTEEVVENPAESQLYNASKISGRTNNGLGVGVFNAIAAKTHATIRDVVSGKKREVQTNPLTNYNILVLDQNLKNNSSVTFLNTNVLRAGGDYDANVTGSVFNFRNKQQSYAVNGKIAVSQQYFPDSTALGHSWNARLSRTSGKFQWIAGYSQESRHYDPNDLGFLFNANEQSVFSNLNYNKNEPFGKFNEAHVSLDLDYSRLYKPNTFADFGFGMEAWAMTKKNCAVGVFTWMEPVETYDFFEPRTDDYSRYYTYPTNWNVGGWFSTDYRKKLAFDFHGNFRRFKEEGRYRLNLEISPRLRVNDRLSFSLSAGSSNFKNDVGYVTTISANDPQNPNLQDIIFGIRDYLSVENVFNTTYIFSNNMSFSFRLRHYWAKAEYSELALLDENGYLAPTNYSGFHDNSFNAFTVDAVYRWRFAPGSDIFLVWKNNASQYSDLQDEVQYNYRQGVERLDDFPQSNSWSVKVIYYLDYLSLMKK